MSKPKFVPTEEQKRTVKSMAAYGIKQEGIARVLRFRSPKTLRKHFREELDLGEIEGVAQVAQTHYQMARSGKYPASTIHFLEKRRRWMEEPLGNRAGGSSGVCSDGKGGGMNISLHPPQWKVFRSPERFRVLVAGRRFGKTYLALTELCRGAAGKGRLACYVAPSIRMAKRIAWKPLKEMTRPFWASRPNETELRIELVGGGTICLRGADNYDSLRGEGLDFLVLDEYASIAPEAWTEVLRPALADKLGRALFIGTPQGHNHFHDLVERAAKLPDWKAFQYTTAQGGNVTPAELESAAKQLDERVFRQEFLGSFVNMGVGRAYYAFDREHNVKGLRYSPHFELCWAIDFNMNPLCSVLVQMSNSLIYVLDEMILPDSNTVAACEELLSRTEKWEPEFGSGSMATPLASSAKLRPPVQIGRL